MAPSPPKKAGRAAADPDVAVALAGLHRIVEVVRRSERALEQQLGLSGAQLYVLRLLASEPAQSLSDLAARTGTHPSTVSVVVSRLVAHGLVTRETSSHDARRITLALTSAGRMVVRRAPAPATERVASALARLPRRARHALAEELERLGTELEGVPPDTERGSGVFDEPPLQPRLAHRDRRQQR
jgi:DNA-binding MarR family transcriptional regulator